MWIYLSGYQWFQGGTRQRERERHEWFKGETRETAAPTICPLMHHHQSFLHCSRPANYVRSRGSQLGVNTRGDGKLAGLLEGEIEWNTQPDSHTKLQRVPTHQTLSIPVPHGLPLEWHLTSRPLQCLVTFVFPPDLQAHLFVQTFRAKFRIGPTDPKSNPKSNPNPSRYKVRMLILYKAEPDNDRERAENSTTGYFQ